MSQTAAIIAVAYAIAVAIGALVAIGIWRSTRSPQAEVAPERYSRREGIWLVVVLLGLFALLMATIFYVPYGESAGASPQRVRVTGVQYAWSVNAPDELRTGSPVEFVVTSQDVNHGFGVYDERGRLLFQVQVIPREQQKVVYTFERAGRYRVLCLEFCGARHHEMVTELEVRA